MLSFMQQPLHAKAANGKDKGERAVNAMLAGNFV
jgi:hypothetical protein